MEEPFFTPADDEHLRRERQKAKELRQSQWWKNRRGNGVCHYCRQAVPPKQLTMDHIVPLIRGGRTTRSNVVPCCQSCNEQKKYLLPLEWDAYLQRLSEPEA